MAIDDEKNGRACETGMKIPQFPNIYYHPYVYNGSRFRGFPTVYNQWIFLPIYTHFYPASIVFTSYKLRLKAVSNLKQNLTAHMDGK
jgi:hypothetical protein